MKDLSIKEILDLVETDINEPEEKIKQIYTWHYDRISKNAQWVLGATGTLLISVILSISKAEMKLVWWQTSIIFLATLATGSYGMYLLWQLKFMHKQYLTALKVFTEFKKIKSFITVYRNSVREGN